MAQTKASKKEEKAAAALQAKLRKFHLKRAEEKSWGLWGWIRDNKNSLVSETAVQKINETMMFAVSEYSAMMDEAAELAELRLRRAQAAEAEVSYYKKQAVADKASLKELREGNRELKGRLKRAGVLISKASKSDSRGEGGLLPGSRKTGSQGLPREQGTT